jgi:hypothetical protein
LGWNLSADHAGGWICLNAVCGGKDETIVRDGHTGFLRYRDAAQHFASRKHASSALNDEFWLELVKREIAA